MIRQEIDGNGVAIERARQRASRRTMQAAAKGEPTRRCDRAEVIRETGIDEAALAELVSYGIVVPDDGGLYTEAEVELVRVCQTMATYGLGPRHLRQLYTGVQRVAGLLDQVLAPALRARNAQRRAQGLDELAQLAGLSADLTERLLLRDVN